jgi:TfoX/Sxy family transcriptional regulator of competence genes
MTKQGESLLDRVRAELALEGEVVEKRMFGSVGFMVRGKLCISARAERIMCRVNPAIVPRLLMRNGCEVVVMKGRKMNGYVYVAAEAVSTRKALAYWVRLALEQNRTISER